MKKQSEGESRQILSAMLEGRIEAQDLACELLPLIQDYFVGDFALSEGGMKLEFKNGQTFLLKIEEQLISTQIAKND